MSTPRWHKFASRTALVFALLATVLIAGCASTPQVRTSAAPAVNLGSFRTFGFFEELSTDRAGYSSLVSQQLMSSARREMEARGFRFESDPKKAELLVNFHAHISEQVRVRSTPDPWINQSYWHHRRGFYQPWPGHRGWPSHSGWATHSNVTVDQFSEGRLSIDIVDASQQMLVWEGVTTQRLNQRTMRDLAPALDRAVGNIFQQFPLPPGL
jgi:hypothetical protein